MFIYLRRLKWGFLPVQRVIEDYEHDNQELETIGSDGTLSVEYRDEANRPWYKFFDEYEYRQNASINSKHRWFKWFNESDTPAERRLIIKLDILLTFYSMMAYWAKFLDQTNVNNAYVSGLKESIGMKGNDLVQSQAMYIAGAVIFQIPFMYILHRLPTNYVLPLLDLGWSTFTLGIYRVENVSQLKVLRFFVGVFEAPSYLAYQYLFGSFYKADEAARRSAFYYTGQFLGVCTSGLLQGRLFESFHMKAGLEGWRWMFIFDSVISFAVGILGFYMLPGTPDHCYSIFLTDDEIRLARKRMRDNKTAKVDYSKSFIDKTMWKNIAVSWSTYALPFYTILLNCSTNTTSGAYVLWLKSLDRYTVSEVNTLSAAAPALGIGWLYLINLYADLMHSRSQAIMISQTMNFICNFMLALWNVPESAKWVSFLFAYTGWSISPAVCMWQGDINRDDQQVRAVNLVIMTMVGQGFAGWTSVLVWKTSEAPRFAKGFAFTAAMSGAMVLWTLVVLYYYKRDEKRNARNNGIVIYDSTKGERIPEIQLKEPQLSKQSWPM